MIILSIYHALAKETNHEMFQLKSKVFSFFLAFVLIVYVEELVNESVVYMQKQKRRKKQHQIHEQLIV